MRQDFVDLLRCPACGGALDLQVDGRREDEVWSGRLTCGRCGERYPITEGIPHVYLDDERWAPIRREAEGWVQMLKDKGIYEPNAAAVDFEIPYFDQPPWIAISRAFDLALEKVALRGDELILDLGAGRGWAAKQFALQGCRAVALDIVADANVGLGRAYVLMAEAGVHFDLLVGDANRLPLPPERIDLVFCCGTLHHADSLESFLVNVGRVLKPGGRLCAISEPCIPIWQDESRRLRQTAAEELAHDINEHLPNLPDYLSACQAAGLRVEQALPSNLWAGEGTDWAGLAWHMGARWGGFHLGQPLASLRNAAYFAGRRLVAALNGTLSGPRPAAGQDEAAAAQADILNWLGGELFLLARKDG